jgi:hypothetical protein
MERPRRKRQRRLELWGQETPHLRLEAIVTVMHEQAHRLVDEKEVGSLKKYRK